ncbi:MAG: hypothetical protein CM1200mP29_03230 [Verrucomicrobiota bacterium]|nr:MAG: hypothetical protein CM1200mP29_03230 [Verrucomicrobiota bacterium]
MLVPTPQPGRRSQGSLLARLRLAKPYNWQPRQIQESMRQNTIQLFGRLATIAAMCLAFGQAQAKPNVLFIFADDQCFETIGSLGLTDINTPNLDP